MPSPADSNESVEAPAAAVVPDLVSFIKRLSAGLRRLQQQQKQQKQQHLVVDIGNQLIQLQHSNCLLSVSDCDDQLQSATAAERSQQVYNDVDRFIANIVISIVVAAERHDHRRFARVHVVVTAAAAN